MAYDVKIAERMRKALAPRKIHEVRMFSGLTFMLNGNMICGVGWNGLLFRVGKEAHAEALKRGAKPMTMNGKEMPGFVWVDPDALDARGLRAWIERAVQYVATLPRKALKKPSRKRVSA
jgi:hypothetical protein